MSGERLCRPKHLCSFEKAAGEWHREKGRGCRADLLQFVKNGKGNMQAYYLSSTCQSSFHFSCPQQAAGGQAAASRQQRQAAAASRQQTAAATTRQQAAAAATGGSSRQAAGSSSSSRQLTAGSSNQQSAGWWNLRHAINSCEFCCKMRMCPMELKMLAQRVVRGAWGSTDSGPAAENGEGDEAAFQPKTAALEPKLATSHGKRMGDVARPNEPKCLQRKNIYAQWQRSRRHACIMPTIERLTKCQTYTHRIKDTWS